MNREEIHAPEPDQDEIVTELHDTLERAAELLHILQKRTSERPAHTGEEPAGEQLKEMMERLESTEEDLSELSTRLVDTENQRGRLMNLYVATYQLHATLDIDEVTATIAEIARDLLGAEVFALLLREESSEECEVALSVGLPAGDQGRYEGGRYRGGDPGVDKTLKDGDLLMEPEPGSEALAVVPLTVQGAIVGAIVILKLFDHKPALTADDRDLLDLLAAHAASALFASRVYSTTDRKLKTLESLVKLVR